MGDKPGAVAKATAGYGGLRAEVALQANRPIKGWIASECAGLDPKDCELCLWRVKPDESLVEARSCSDVQIDDHT